MFLALLCNLVRYRFSRRPGKFPAACPSPRDKPDAIPGQAMMQEESKVACIGAGNLTKGMLYPLFTEAGYDVTIVCLTEKSYRSLQGGYSYLEVGRNVCKKEYPDVKVRLLKDMRRDELATFRYITTAVGRDNMGRVADRLAEQPLRPEQRVFMCENDLESFRLLRPLTENVHVSVVDRIVFYENPKEVVGEEYYSFEIFSKQNIPLPDFMGRSGDFERDFTKKWYLVNTLHVITAWYAYFLGYETINEALASPDVLAFVQSVSEELVTILRHKYPDAPSEEFQTFARKCIQRFGNKNLNDRVLRVGRNTLNKLGPDERLLDPILYARKFGLPHTSLLQSSSYGLLFYADRERVKHDLRKQENIFSYIESTAEAAPCL